MARLYCATRVKQLCGTCRVIVKHMSYDCTPRVMQQTDGFFDLQPLSKIPHIGSMHFLCADISKISFTYNLLHLEIAIQTLQLPPP